MNARMPQGWQIINQINLYLECASNGLFVSRKYIMRMSHGWDLHSDHAASNSRIIQSDGITECFRIGLCWWMDGSETDHYVYFYLFAGLFWHWKRIWSAIRYWAKVHFPLWSCSNMNEILNISIPAVQIWAFAIKYHSIFSLTYSFSQSLTCSLTLFVTSLLTHRLYRLALSFTHSAENNENLLCCCPLLEYAEAIGSVTCRSAHYLDTHTQCV